MACVHNSDSSYPALWVSITVICCINVMEAQVLSNNIMSCFVTDYLCIMLCYALILALCSDWVELLVISICSDIVLYIMFCLLFLVLYTVHRYNSSNMPISDKISYFANSSPPPFGLTLLRTEVALKRVS